MPTSPDRHHRRSIRLAGYDYSRPGAYFVTICTEDRECLFGEIIAGEMRLNDAGAIALAVWNDLPMHYAHVQLERFVIMPNHVHGIIILTDDVAVVGAGLKPAPTQSVPTDAATTGVRRHGLPEIVRAFKTFSARRINELRGTPGVPVWQRNYYEHVVRTAESLERIRAYIETNPERWAWDRENAQVCGSDPMELWIFDQARKKGQP
jgi:REP element-mobilizing transposase RayT